MMTFISALQRYRFIWLNLLFMGYLWLLQPSVLQRLVASSRNTNPDWLMGGLLLGIQIIEMAGLLLKRPVSAFYARYYPDSSDQGGCLDNGKVVLFIFTPIFHLSVSAILTILASGLLGMGPNDNTATLWQCLLLPLFFAALTKEVFYIILMLSIGSIGSAPRQTQTQSHSSWGDRINHWLAPPEITQITLKDAVKDVAGDLLLLAFAALAYTTLWEFITAGSPLRRQGVARLPEYLGVSIFFFMVYFTTRSVYLMQELNVRQSQTARIFSWISFLAVWLTALGSIPTR